MTDNLVARLRHCSTNTNDEYLHELTGRASDELEALRAENARLRKALQHTQDKLHDAMMPDGLYAEDAARALRVVNAALAAPPATGKEG